MQQAKKLWGHLPVLSSSLLLLTAMAFATRRNLYSFLLSQEVLPALLLIALTIGGVSAFRGGNRKKVFIAALLILATPVVSFAAWHLTDPIAFYVWSATHRGQLRRSMDKDQVILGWRSSGFAGNEWDDYLIFDASDNCSSLTSVNIWRTRMHLACEIGRTQRVWPQLCIVTTFNCPFDGVNLPID